MKTKKLRRISLNENTIGYLDCGIWWLRTKRDSISEYSGYFDVVKDYIDYNYGSWKRGIIVSLEI